MKKVIILFSIALIILILGLVVIQTRRNSLSVKYSEESQPPPILETAASPDRQTKKAVILSTKTKPDFSQELALVQDWAEEFNLPAELTQELSEAVREGNIDSEWAREQISEEELRQTGLTAGQIAQSTLDSQGTNIVAGFKTSDKTLEEMFKACLPAEDASDDEQTRILKSEALATVGFSAMKEYKYDQAEKAFKSLIRYYGNSEVTSMVRLEYGRLLFEQGRAAEAKEVIDEAIVQNRDDQEYVAIAEGLREKIEGDE